MPLNEFIYDSCSLVEFMFWVWLSVYPGIDQDLANFGISVFAGAKEKLRRGDVDFVLVVLVLDYFAGATGSFSPRRRDGRKVP